MITVKENNQHLRFIMAHEKPNHDYHILPLSPLPIYTSISMFILAIGAVLYMNDHHHAERLALLGLVGVVLCLFSWWRQVIREGDEDKAHTGVVQKGLRLGMALFIASEVMFFFAFFFSYFTSFFHAIWFETGVYDFNNLITTEEARPWPPEGIKTFDPWDIPFLNTLILLLSGTSVTWAHHSLLHGDRKGLVHGLGWTVFLGFIFTCFQAYEYSHALFGFTDGNYASNFFMATGFHGFHVIVGTIFLFVCWIRAIRGNLTKKHHLGFEFAAWYWHFVDVVWLFLFVSIYWWGA